MPLLDGKGASAEDSKSVDAQKAAQASGILCNSSPFISALFGSSANAPHNYLTAGHYLCVAMSGIYASV